MAAPRIVVGVDGSDGSVAALRWAYEEARWRDATVDVIHAWHLPYVGDLAGMAGYGLDHGAFAEGAQEVLSATMARAGPGPEGVAVEPILAQGSPATVLLEAARGADLLVVGATGHGALAELVLGSVSRQCTHHAPCPVVIVPVPGAQTDRARD